MSGYKNEDSSIRGGAYPGGNVFMIDSCKGLCI